MDRVGKGVGGTALGSTRKRRLAGGEEGMEEDEEGLAEDRWGEEKRQDWWHQHQGRSRRGI